MLLMRHLFATAVRTFFRMLFTGVIFAALAAGIVLGVAYYNSSTWPPSTLTYVAAAAMAILAGYASALTVLVREAARGLRMAEEGVIKATEGAAKAAENAADHKPAA
jgi:ABC-type Fe3+-siderophore transport system permease subunit